jgi:hypothetical protein
MAAQGPYISVLARYHKAIPQYPIYIHPIENSFEGKMHNAVEQEVDCELFLCRWTKKTICVSGRPPCRYNLVQYTVTFNNIRKTDLLIDGRFD